MKDERWTVDRTAARIPAHAAIPPDVANAKTIASPLRNAWPGRIVSLSRFPAFPLRDSSQEFI
ncbi:hypothetical protein X946_5215 [Burkholderia sp. ABCPW 111]|nr:hypothetical protein X946_5215 [Burkholderia sp. ABCPW 111]